MGDREYKAILKEAREFIKAKDFKAALKEVKKVLNKDKNNYMGLVFCGLCLSELDQPDQAIQAYKRATDSAPDQATAWEGLTKLYDKYSEKTEYRKDHISCLNRLLTLNQSDFGKSYDLWSKIAQLELDNLELAAAVGTLQAQAQAAKKQLEAQEQAATCQEKYRTSLEMIVRVLSQQPVLASKLDVVYENTLDQLINDTGTAQNIENIKLMIKLLYKVRKLEKLVGICLEMHRMSPESNYPLEWICKVYLEWASGTLEFERAELQDPSPYYEQLLKSNSNSTLGKLARGAHLCLCGSLDEGIQELARGTEGSSPNLYALFLLTRAEFKAGRFSAVEVSASTAIKFIDKVKEEGTRMKVCRELNLMSIKALYKQASKEKLQTAINHFEGSVGFESLDAELASIIAKVYATLGKAAKVAEIKDKVELEAKDTNIVQALLLKSQGDLVGAENLLVQSLVESPESVEVMILLGRINWENDNKEQSLGYFLKAAKLEPGSWVPFVYLGHHYKSLNTPQGLDKARKCYQKCLQINPHEVEAGKGLSDIYRQTGKLQENLSFLSEVTGRSMAASGRCTWAWLRLGVHHLAADQPTQAVQAFQAALRGDSGDVTCWEALADAYMARGSFNAALKAFEKVQTMKENSEYARLMIAAIKDRVGKWRDASTDYRAILEHSPEYLPALRGLGESLLSQAQNYIDDHIDSNAVGCIEEALTVLTRAAELRPSLHGTWRLLGDCCSILGVLPASTVHLEVPAKLTGGETGSEEVDKSKLMEIGSRCYIRSLTICPDNWRVWHQLAILYSHLADFQNSREYKLKSLGMMKHAVSLAPSVNTVWTSLGIVASQCSDWGLAQHSLITSLELETSSAAWTVLGVVYLHLGHAHLANRAFKEAQNNEPGNLRGWAGQALVAEVAGFRSESMDLFRHCTFLGGEAESALGYANWVLSTLKDINNGEQVESHNRYILDKMHGVTVAVDSLTLYCRRCPDSSLALCQLSVLLERQGLLRKALSVAQHARDILIQTDKDDLLDKVLCNLGRINHKLGNHQKAIQAFKAIRTPTFYSEAGMALAHFSLNNFQESYEIYKSSFHWLADQEALKSDILVAMGCLAYKVEGPDVAKTLFFQSCQMASPSVRGILALCVLGIQSSDLNLIEAALAEMKVHEHDPRHAHDIAFLRASVMLLKGDLKGARRSLVRAVHQQPWLSGIWRVVSVFLLLNCSGETAAAAAFSRKAGALGRDQKEEIEKFKHISVIKGFQDIGSNVMSAVSAESLVVESLCLLSAGDRVGARRVGSKLCHLYPHLAQSWAILTASGDKSTDLVGKLLAYVGSAGDELLADWVNRQL